MDDGKSAPAKVRTSTKNTIKVKAKGFLNPAVESSKSAEPKEEPKDTPNTLKQKKPTFQPSKRQKTDQYEEQLSGGQDNMFAKSASLGGVASYTISRLHPAQYLQLGVMTFLVNMNFACCAYFQGLVLKDVPVQPKTYSTLIQKVFSQCRKLDPPPILFPGDPIKRCKANGKSHPIGLLQGCLVWLPMNAKKFLACKLLHGCTHRSSDWIFDFPVG